MFKFILRFIGSIVKEQKGRMFIIFTGMVICSFFVLNFFYSCMVGANTKEEIYERYFKVELQYKTTEDVEKLLSELDKEEHITKVELSAWFNDKSENAVPESIHDSENMYYGKNRVVAYIPELKNKNNQIEIGRTLQEEDNGKVLVTYANCDDVSMFQLGEKLHFAGEQLEIIGLYNELMMGYVVTADTLLEMCRNIQDGPIQMTYWYDETMSDKQIKACNKKLNQLKRAENVIYEKPDIDISWNAVSDQGKFSMMAMILAVVNFMFVYQFVLKNRTRQYRTLKLLGVTGNKLQAVLFLEMFITLSIAFLIAIGLLYGSIILRDKVAFGMGKVYLISYGLMFVMTGGLFLGFTRSFTRKSPFASYQEN